MSNLVVNQPTKQLPKARVLIVDDDQGVRASLSTVLGEDFAVVAVDSVAGGRYALAVEHFDVVISDFEMPDQDGLSLLDFIRQRHPSTVGILLTGRAAHEKVGRAQRDWARYRVLLKPVDPQLLVSTVRDCIRVSRLRKSTERLSNRLGK